MVPFQLVYPSQDREKTIKKKKKKKKKIEYEMFLSFSFCVDHITKEEKTPEKRGLFSERLKRAFLVYPASTHPENFLCFLLPPLKTL